MTPSVGMTRLKAVPFKPELSRSFSIRASLLVSRSFGRERVRRRDSVRVQYTCLVPGYADVQSAAGSQQQLTVLIEALADVYGDGGSAAQGQLDPAAGGLADRAIQLVCRGLAAGCGSGRAGDGFRLRWQE